MGSRCPSTLCKTILMFLCISVFITSLPQVSLSAESVIEKLLKANSYRREGKLKEAKELYAECLPQSEMLSPHVKFYLGLIYMNGKDYTTALSYFKELWRSREKLPIEIKAVLPYRIAQIYENLGKLERAYGFYLLSLELGTAYIRKVARYRLALISFRKRSYKKASEWILSILSDYPRDKDANDLLLRLLPYLRSPGKEVLYRAGRAYYLRGEYKIALRYFKRSRKLFWEAITLERLGRRRDAFRLYGALLKRGVIWETLVRRYVALSESINAKKKAYSLLRSILKKKKHEDLILFYLYYLTHDSRYKRLLLKEFPRSKWALRVSWLEGWRRYISGKYRDALSEWRIILKYHAGDPICARVIYYLMKKGLYSRLKARRVLSLSFPLEYYTVRKYGISLNRRKPSLPKDALSRKLLKAGFWEFAFIRGNLLNGIPTPSRKLFLSIVSEKMFNYHSSVAYATYLILSGWRDRDVWRRAYPLTNYFSYIVKISKREKVDPLLVLSVIHQESKFNPRAVSWAGAVGLMQIMPFTARSLGVKDRNALFSPYVNIKLGIVHLAGFMRKYKNNLYLALAAYNAGGGNVSRWISKIKAKSWEEWMEMIPYRETRNYVKKVIAAYRIYKELYRKK
ncbi:MAG: lytic transglycosylase domain-containing protein [Synergistetes bacterium]|nr:lytic transglycosylase domain-containing protein [Synergistota bacterium]